MTTCVLDRSCLSHLYLYLVNGESWRLRNIKTACDSFDRLSYDPEGTSVLQRTLSRCDWLREKLVPCRFGDIRLSDQESDRLTAVFRRLERSQVVCDAAQAFHAATQAQARDVTDALGYVFRIAALARAHSAAMLCWEPRATFLREVLQAAMVGVSDEVRAGCTGFRTVATRFPYDEADDAGAFEYSILSYPDPLLTGRSVFLSYSRADTAFVRRLVGDITVAGGKVWLDEAEIDPGDSLVERIEEGLGKADIMMVVLSPDSVRSAWVLRELRVATRREIADQNPRVVPVLLRSCDIPVLLGDKAYVDFRNPDLYSTSLDSLLVCAGLAQRTD